MIRPALRPEKLFYSELNAEMREQQSPFMTAIALRMRLTYVNRLGRSYPDDQSADSVSDEQESDWR